MVLVSARPFNLLKLLYPEFTMSPSFILSSGLVSLPFFIHSKVVTRDFPMPYFIFMITLLSDGTLKVVLIENQAILIPLIEKKNQVSKLVSRDGPQWTRPPRTCTLCSPLTHWIWAGLLAHVKQTLQTWCSADSDARKPGNFFCVFGSPKLQFKKSGQRDLLKRPCRMITRTHGDEEVLRLQRARDRGQEKENDSTFPASQLNPAFQSFLQDATYVCKPP